MAFFILTTHFDVMIAPFFNKRNHETGLHKPRKHGVQCEYHLKYVMRRLGQEGVVGTYSKAYASSHRGVAVARLAGHRR
jgi:hypothetical protein